MMAALRTYETSCEEGKHVMRFKCTTKSYAYKDTTSLLPQGLERPRMILQSSDYVRKKQLRKQGDPCFNTRHTQQTRLA